MPEFTLEHYIGLGISFVLGILITMFFSRVSSAKAFTRYEVDIANKDKLSNELEEKLETKDLELNAIRKQTVDLMKSEAQLKSKIKADKKSYEDKRLLLEKLELKISKSGGMASKVSDADKSETESQFDELGRPIKSKSAGISSEQSVTLTHAIKSIGSKMEDLLNNNQSNHNSVIEKVAGLEKGQEAILTTVDPNYPSIESRPVKKKIQFEEISKDELERIQYSSADYIENSGYDEVDEFVQV